MSTTKCPKCGYEVNGGTMYCPDCGCKISDKKENAYEAASRIVKTLSGLSEERMIIKVMEDTGCSLKEATDAVEVYLVGSEANNSIHGAKAAKSSGKMLWSLLLWLFA